MADFNITKGFDYIQELPVPEMNIDLSQYSLYLDFYDSFGNLQFSVSTISLNGNFIAVSVSSAETTILTSGYYILYASSSTERYVIYRGQVSVFPEVESNIEYLIPYLRIKIGDVESPHRYLDEWLKLSLAMAIKSLQRYWKSKYLIDSDFVVYRNPDVPEMFVQDESLGVIEQRDEPIIVLKAAIIILEGSFENSSWNTGSWRDAEISYSNIEGGKMKRDVLMKLQEELDDYLLPPTKRLGNPIRGRLAGYINYPPEYGDNIKTQ